MLGTVWIGLWTGFFVLIADALSKYWVHAKLPIMSSRFPVYPYGGLPIFDNFLGIEFSITHLTNRGAAWGTFGSYQDVLLGVRILLIMGMIAYLWRLRYQPTVHFFLCLVIAGALGNVIDYFAYGHVVDMFHFVLWGYHFPVFNIADSAVCIGICGILAISFWQDLTMKVGND